MSAMEYRFKYLFYFIYSITFLSSYPLPPHFPSFPNPLTFLAIRNCLKINFTSKHFPSHMSNLSSSDLSEFQTPRFILVHLMLF